jgi:hypothetical protein
MDGYHLVRGNIAFQDQLNEQPLSQSLIELMLSRKEGCAIYAVSEPQTDAQRRVVDRGGVTTHELCLNYGPVASPFMVGLTPQKFFGKPNPPWYWVMDNCLEHRKTFFQRSSFDWRHIDKVGNNVTLIGSVEEAYKILTEAFTFLQEPFLREDPEKRRLRIQQVFQREGTYHNEFNPKGR